jgi:hypothetical protein
LLEFINKNETLQKVPIVAFYNIVEITLFFRFQMYNWPFTLIFRIIFVLHDFAYFIAYVLIGGQNGEYYGSQCKSFSQKCTDPDLLSDLLSDQFDCGLKEHYCEMAASGYYSIASCVFFFFTFAIGIGILITYSKFPKYGGSCCPPPPVMMINGQMVQMRTVTTQRDGQTYSSLVLTQQPNVANQPMLVQPTTLPVTVAISNDRPPSYDFCSTRQQHS